MVAAASSRTLRDHILDGLADGDGEQDDLVAASEVLANLRTFDMEGRVGLHDLALTVVVVELPDAARLGEQARILAGVLNEPLVEVLGAHEPRVAACLLGVNPEQGGVVDGHRDSSS